jgi:hypothetical protein
MVSRARPGHLTNIIALLVHCIAAGVVQAADMNRGAGKPLPYSGGWNRLPGDSPQVPLEEQLESRFSLGEEAASMNTKPILRIRRTCPCRRHHVSERDRHLYPPRHAAGGLGEHHRWKGRPDDDAQGPGADVNVIAADRQLGCRSPSNPGQRSGWDPPCPETLSE